jgi:hypothetical protein
MNRKLSSILTGALLIIVPAYKGLTDAEISVIVAHMRAVK